MWRTSSSWVPSFLTQSLTAGKGKFQRGQHRTLYKMWSLPLFTAMGFSLQFQESDSTEGLYTLASSPEQPCSSLSRWKHYPQITALTFSSLPSYSPATTTLVSQQEQETETKRFQMTNRVQIPQLIWCPT